MLGFETSRGALAEAPLVSEISSAAIRVRVGFWGFIWMECTQNHEAKNG
jgi:hypothetical protein